MPKLVELDRTSQELQARYGKNTWSWTSVAKAAVEALRKIEAGANMSEVFEALYPKTAEEDEHLRAHGPASTLWAMARTGAEAL